VLKIPVAVSFAGVPNGTVCGLIVMLCGLSAIGNAAPATAELNVEDPGAAGTKR